MYKLFSDGGSRGNPGEAASACVIFNDDTVIDFASIYLGTATNNQAEYKGLQLGIDLLKKRGVEEVICYLDSELVVKQLNGEYKIKEPQIILLAENIKKSVKLFKSVQFVHIPRKENWIADKLVNIVLDATAK